MANWETRYFNAKKKLMTNKSVCKENKDLFNRFFEFQEKKLKRINNLRKLDEPTYKTLYSYILKIKNIIKWFNGKAIEDLTKEDIQKVYDDLEDGKIKNNRGVAFEDLENSYYSKTFKSKLFEMAGKIDLAREVIQYTGKNNKEVRFITEEDFKKLVNNAYKPHHRLLLWLAWDIGENINALIQLKKSDFFKQKNTHTKEDEYRVNLKREILKRGRKPRSEITNYTETIKLLDQHLEKLKDNDPLFNFGYRSSKKIIDRAVERAGIKCIPNCEKVTWKDLRSGMSCHLLKTGWTTDEVNARLGHKPSSDEIDKYINFLAIDRSTPKKKLHQFEMEKLNEEVNEMKEREKIQIKRMEELQKDMPRMIRELMGEKERDIEQAIEEIKKKAKV